MTNKVNTGHDGSLEPLEFEHRRSMRRSKGLSYPFEAPKGGTVQKVAPGILWLRMPLPFSLDHINLYLLEGHRGWTIVDSGLRSRRGEEIWMRLLADLLQPKPVSRVLITHYHPDHVGLAGWLTEETGAPLWMSRGEYLTARTLMLDVRNAPPEETVAFYRRAGLPAERLEQFRRAGFGNYARIVYSLPVGYRRLRHGDRLVIGKREWRVIVGSGHSPEHICLFSETDRILISGDQVLPRITSNVSVFPTEPESNPLSDWFASLDRLMDLPEDTFVLPSHNEPFRGLHRRLDGLFESHLDKLQALAAFCSEPATAVDAFPALFTREIDGSEFFMAVGESLAHMHFLESLGVLERSDRDGREFFQTVKSFDLAAVRRNHAPAAA